MVQCGFNTIVPALVFKLRIFALYPLGNLTTGGYWSNGNGIGVLTSVPGYEPAVNATSIHMDDFNVVHSTGPYTLDANGLVQTDDGHVIGVHSKGLLSNTASVRAILVNSTDAAPTRWGEVDTLTTWSFQASGKYEALTTAVFVANIQLMPSDDEDTVSYINYRLSQVLPGPVCEDVDEEEENEL
ncbi:hypothetical protein F4777DRAFT_549513 [Nemania sp. FL0916]|nr:hypothetical protein F4777DRAFT_549513 [Nemania sp. FL0916]